MKKVVGLSVSALIALGLFAGCGTDGAEGESADQNEADQVAASEAGEENRSYSYDVDPVDYEPIEPHKDLDQEPIPVKQERIGENEVNIEMTAQITDIEIAPGIDYKTWNFNG